MKKTVLILLMIATFLGNFSACAKTEDSNEHLDSSIVAPSSDATEATEPLSSYQPGKWTVRGYTSEWLNMSYDKSGSYKMTDESIRISKQFDEIKKAEDPYWAITEMYFKNVFDIKNAPTPISLTVELLEDGDQTSEECADKYEQELRAVAVGLGIKEDILDEKEAEIVFLGETYVLRYSKIKSLGITREYCRLYLVKEGYLVVFTYAHLANYFFIDIAFTGFSALDGNDYKGICSACSCGIPYKIVDTDESVCLECFFDNKHAQDFNDNQADSTEPEPTTPVAPTAAPTEPPAPCSHNYKAATCTAPKTCTKCGATEGSSVGHSWSAATCIVSQTCTVCGATTGGLADHVWKEATCTEPSMCTVCWQTSGEPYGHSMNATKCRNCDHSDFSTFAKKYTSVEAYDFNTGADFEVTNVSLSSYGMLTFTFQGKDYSATLVQARADSFEANFDCYENGIRIQDAEARINMNGSDYTFHFKWSNVNGCRLYFNTRG